MQHDFKTKINRVQVRKQVRFSWQLDLDGRTDEV